jgi:hypothetical protein
MGLFLKWWRPGWFWEVLARPVALHWIITGYLSVALWWVDRLLRLTLANDKNSVKLCLCPRTRERSSSRWRRGPQSSSFSVQHLVRKGPVRLTERMTKKCKQSPPWPESHLPELASLFITIIDYDQCAYKSRKPSCNATLYWRAQWWTTRKKFWTAYCLLRTNNNNHYHVSFFILILFYL